MTPKRRVAIVICAVLVPALAWQMFFRSRAVALGAATWFVASPSGREIAVGRPDGALDFIDLNGANLGPVVVGKADDAVVFAADDTRFVIQGGAALGTKRYVARQAGQAPMIIATEIEVAAGRTLVPVVEGACHRGRLEKDATEMLLAVLAADGRVERVLWLELIKHVTREIALPPLEDDAIGISAAPQHAGFALLCVPKGAPHNRASARVRLFDAGGAPTYVIEDAAPVQPYWLPDLGSLLFERAAGGISRFYPPDGKPVWVCDGRFPTDDIARGYLGVRDMQEPFVLVEKKDGDDFVQIARIWPFETVARRTMNITTGLIHKFGLAVSGDRHRIAFRQVDGALGREPMDERLVLVDQSASFRASTIAYRSMPPGMTDVGPVFTVTDSAVLYVAEGRLWKAKVD